MLHLSDMVNYYINNKDQIDNMFLAYQDKFADEISALDHAPLSLPLRPKEFIKLKQLRNLFANITTREFECLRLLSEGQTSKLAARTLQISPRTVERHFDNIKEKLQLKNKVQIITKYREYLTLYQDVAPHSS